LTEPKQLDNKALGEWREKHFHELDDCLKVSAEIRDNSEASPRERNTAIRNIASMLGALTEKSAPQAQKKQARIDAPEHSDAHQTELETYLSELQ
jgi:hypothetical protein